MRNLIIFLLILIISEPSCTNYNDKAESNITQIRIVNHTNNKFIKRDTTLIDTGSLAQFTYQYNHMKQITYADVRYIFGSFELVIKFNNNHQQNIGVVYTVYDGVVILDESNGKMYKNDLMEGLMIKDLQ